MENNCTVNALKKHGIDRDKSVWFISPMKGSEPRVFMYEEFLNSEEVQL